ncbi:hypothetical protein EsH8_X_000694 [Colletotrichum jinshuiense]
MKLKMNGPLEPNDAPPSYEEVGQHPSRDQLFDSAEWEDVSPSLSILFAPTLDAALYGENGTEWSASLHVKVKDLPRLMREGFHWTLVNFHREASFFNKNISEPPLRQSGWSCSRTYYLSDLDEDDPQWTAKLMVCARERQVLTRFRLVELRPELVFYTLAWNPECREQFYYTFDRHDPEKNFNAIYDDMPLEGWWPWPKRQASN